MSKSSKPSKPSRTFVQVTAISFNHDGSKVAVCPGSREIIIYATNGSRKDSAWTVEHVLKEHLMEVTALDWNAANNKIVSGSIDRSVFVWKFDEGANRWEPEFVNLDEKLSVICISWAKQGHKLVVGTSSKVMYVVYDDPE